MKRIEISLNCQVYLVEKGKFYPYEEFATLLASFESENDAIRYAKECSSNFVERHLVVFDGDEMIAQYLNGDKVPPADWIK